MSRSNPNGFSRNDSSVEAANGVAPKRGMVLPFTPLAMSFDDVSYFVDMPPVSDRLRYRDLYEVYIHSVIVFLNFL